MICYADKPLAAVKSTSVCGESTEYVRGTGCLRSRGQSQSQSQSQSSNWPWLWCWAGCWWRIPRGSTATATVLHSDTAVMSCLTCHSLHGRWRNAWTRPAESNGPLHYSDIQMPEVTGVTVKGMRGAAENGVEKKQRRWTRQRGWDFHRESHFDSSIRGRLALWTFSRTTPYLLEEGSKVGWNEPKNSIKN